MRSVQQWEKGESQSGYREQQRRVWLLWAAVEFFFVWKDVNSALMEETHSDPLDIFQSKIVNNHLKSTFSTLGEWMHSLATLFDAAFSRLQTQTARQPITRRRLAWQQLSAFGRGIRMGEERRT